MSNGYGGAISGGSDLVTGLVNTFYGGEDDPLEEWRGYGARSMASLGTQYLATGQLPKAMQMALNSIRSMVGWNTTGAIDQAVRDAQGSLRTGSQAMAERGIGPGGQQTAMEQQTMDKLMQNILGARREGYQTYAASEADIWKNLLDTFFNSQMALIGGSQSSAGGSSTAQNAALITQGAGDLAGGLYQAFSQPTQQPQYVNTDPFSTPSWQSSYSNTPQQSPYWQYNPYSR